MNPADILKYINDGGIIGLLVFILVSGYKEWWVFGRQLREAQSREQEWKAMALRNIDANERALEIAQAMQGLVKQPPPPNQPAARRTPRARGRQ